MVVQTFNGICLKCDGISLQFTTSDVENKTGGCINFYARNYVQSHLSVSDFKTFIRTGKVLA